MLEKIAEVIGVEFNVEDAATQRQLNMIVVELPEGTTELDADFAEKVREAELVAATKLNSMFGAMATVVVDAAEKQPTFVAKVKTGTPKGSRIAVVGFGKFSFGPVWNASVRTGDGIAFLDAHSDKLAAQAVHLGIFLTAEDARAAVKESAKNVASSIVEKLDSTVETVETVETQVSE